MSKRDLIRTTVVVTVLVAGMSLAAVNLVSREAAAAGWRTGIVEATSSQFVSASLALDGGGNPHIAYWGGPIPSGEGNLNYASWTGSDWIIERIDSTKDVGLFPGLAIDKRGFAHVSYYDYGSTALKYARWTGDRWSIVMLDSFGDVGSSTSIALDAQDRPHISYYDSDNGHLKHAGWTGVGWMTETVDFSPDTGGSTSIAVDSGGNPHISYWDETNDTIRYAKRTGAAWAIETVDWSNFTDIHTFFNGFISMALDPAGHPHISYPDFNHSKLMYARWTGSGWGIEVVDPTAPATASSLALNASGHPRIAYLSGAGSLSYASFDGTTWSIESVDSGYWVGLDASLALDHSGYAHIAYGDYVNMTVKYATNSPPNNPPDAPSTPSGPAAVDAGTSHTYSAAATDPDSDPVRYTFDWNDGTTSQTGLVNSGSAAGQPHTWSSAGTYQVRVSALDVHGASSSWSSSLTVTVSDVTGLPGTPTGLTLTISGNDVILFWNAPSDDGGSPIVNYTVYRGTTPTEATFLAMSGGVITFTDKAPAPGQTYYYRVSAMNSVGEGPKSAPAAVVLGSDPGATEKPTLEDSWFWSTVALALVLVGVTVTLLLRGWRGKKDKA